MSLVLKNQTKLYNLNKLEMRKILCLTAFVLIAITNAMGQQTSIVSGVITDAKNQPLPGVSIVIEGTMKGASSDFNGNYEITSISEGIYTVTASFVGYKSVSNQITVSGANVSQNFILQDDLLSLDEVIVTGSSNPKTKLESSIAVTTMSAKQIEARSPQSTADLLQSIPGWRSWKQLICQRNCFSRSL